MDDFREWLSDNLRYFELGGAVLLVVLLLFFGIRACRGGGKRKASSGNQTTVSETQVADTQQSEVTEEDTSPVVLDPLVSADKDVTALIRNYYEARSRKDVEGVRAVVDELDPVMETQIENDLFTNYKVEDVSTKHGLGENALVVFVTYTYECQGISTPVPAVDQLYVTRDSDGVWRIDGDASTDTQISSFMKAIASDADVEELVSAVKTRYDNTLASDPALASYLSGLGQEVVSSQSDSTPTGERLVTTTDVNFRSSPSNDASVITVLDEGTYVEKLGDESGWIKVEYNGQTGYVYGEYLSGAGSVSSGDSSDSSEDSSDSSEEDSYEDEEYYYEE